MNTFNHLLCSLITASFLAACHGAQKDEIEITPPGSAEKQVQWTRDKCGNKQYFVKSDLTVEDLVSNALKNARAGNIKINPSEFVYVHLDYKSLADLYSRLYALQSEGMLITSLTFDIRDYMLRLSVVDSGALGFFKTTVEAGHGVFQGFDPNNSEFHLLAQSLACPMSSLEHAVIYRDIE